MTKRGISSLFITMTLLSLQTMAADLPLCSDYSVILSLTPVKCEKDETLLDFDIPELKLDTENIEKIFEENKQKLGSESSGGRQIGPSSMSQNQSTHTDLVQLRCKLQVISDGGKSVSYLSEQSFSLIPNSLDIKVFPSKFKHYLIKGNNFYPSSKYSVTKKPPTDLSQFVINFNYLQGRENKIKIQLCRKLNNDSNVCSTKTRIKKYLKRVTLKMDETVKFSPTYSVTKKLRLSCKK